MSTKYVPPRTFGDLLKHHPNGEARNQCAFCKKDGYDLGDLYKYSTRHYICAPCIEPRKDVVLPEIARHEKFQAKMQQLA